MTDKPRWFLDVDGPINSTNPGKVWHVKYAEDTVQAETHGYVLRYAPPLINHIRDIAKGGLVDIAWCTTWVPFADRLEKTFMLPPLLTAFTECTRYDAWSKKVQAVQDFDAESDQPWVWTDDEAPRQGAVYDKMTASGKGLILKISPTTGITPQDLTLLKGHLGLLPSMPVV